MANRIALGQLQTGVYGLRVSLPGYNALTALNPEQCAFDSAWAEMVQIHAAGVGTCSSSDTISWQGTYYRLATFSSQGFVPTANVWQINAVSGGANSDTPFNLALGTLVTETGIYLGYNIYAYPSYTGEIPTYQFAWVVSKVPMLS